MYIFHCFIVLSLHATYISYGLLPYIIECISPLLPIIFLRHTPEDASHNLILPSIDVVANNSSYISLLFRSPPELLILSVSGNETYALSSSYYYYYYSCYYCNGISIKYILVLGIILLILILLLVYYVKWYIIYLRLGLLSGSSNSIVSTNLAISTPKSSLRNGII